MSLRKIEEKLFVCVESTLWTYGFDLAIDTTMIRRKQRERQDPRAIMRASIGL